MRFALTCLLTGHAYYPASTSKVVDPFTGLWRRSRMCRRCGHRKVEWVNLDGR